jgi:alanine dehydrogenase
MANVALASRRTAARRLVGDGHEVVVESGAGATVGFFNAAYASAGATIASSPDAVWTCALIVKVKELQPAEFAHLVAGTTIFGFASSIATRRFAAVRA